MTIFRRQMRLVALIVLAIGALATASQDAYENYVKTSRDFKPVKQDRQFLLGAFPSWAFMPWPFQWTIGNTDAAARFCEETGINGAVIDQGKTNTLPWINKHKLYFYVDHLAGKGDIHIRSSFLVDKSDLIRSNGVRVIPLNEAMRVKVKNLIKTRIAKLDSSPSRAAYALDDEISWGDFVRPCMWNVTDDETAYTNWLKEIYGPDSPKPAKWIGYDEIQPKLAGWSLATFDASPLMDQWSFNDSFYNNFLGECRGVFKSGIFGASKSGKMEFINEVGW